jgi:hypothetical protein
MHNIVQPINFERQKGSLTSKMEALGCAKKTLYGLFGLLHDKSCKFWGFAATKMGNKEILRCGGTGGI